MKARNYFLSLIAGVGLWNYFSYAYGQEKNTILLLNNSLSNTNNVYNDKYYEQLHLSLPISLLHQIGVLRTVFPNDTLLNDATVLIIKSIYKELANRHRYKQSMNFYEFGQALYDVVAQILYCTKEPQALTCPELIRDSLVREQFLTGVTDTPTKIENELRNIDQISYEIATTTIQWCTLLSEGDPDLVWSSSAQEYERMVNQRMNILHATFEALHGKASQLTHCIQKMSLPDIAGNVAYYAGSLSSRMMLYKKVLKLLSTTVSFARMCMGKKVHSIDFQNVPEVKNGDHEQELLIRKVR